MGGRILALLIKEFLAIVKDRKSRFVLIAPPLIQVFVFGYAASFDLDRIPYAVYNEDRTQASRELVARFGGSAHFREAAAIEHPGQIAPLLDERQVLLVLRIGPRFGSDLMRGRHPRVQVLIDGRNSNTALAALNYVRTVLEAYSDAWNAGRKKESPPARLVVRAWFNPNLESQWFIVPGIVALLTQVVTTVITALSVAREREQGTFDQLLVTPLAPFEILVGKALPGLFIGLFEASLIIVVAVLWFRIPLTGSLSALYLGIVLFLFSVIGVGLMISSLSITQQQGLLGAFLFIVPSVILSGFATPIANMPAAVQYFTLINPMRYFLVVVRAVFLEAAPTQTLLSQYLPMALIGLVCLTCAGWLFRRRMY